MFHGGLMDLGVYYNSANYSDSKISLGTHKAIWKICTISRTIISIQIEAFTFYCD
jgi:hypothetical protein